MKGKEKEEMAVAVLVLGSGGRRGEKKKQKGEKFS